MCFLKIKKNLNEVKIGIPKQQEHTQLQWNQPKKYSNLIKVELKKNPTFIFLLFLILTNSSTVSYKVNCGKLNARTSRSIWQWEARCAVRCCCHVFIITTTITITDGVSPSRSIITFNNIIIGTSSVVVVFITVVSECVLLFTIVVVGGDYWRSWTTCIMFLWEML